MTAPSSIDPARFLHEQLAQASPDLLRQMLTTFINTLMSAEADAVCGAGYGERSSERTNVRNGYRSREFDTRAGTLDVAIPKLRSGSYFPDWLLERRRRAERALTTVVATCYLLGVSTRRMENLVESLGITRLSNSQVSQMARDLDAQVEPPGRRARDAPHLTTDQAQTLLDTIHGDRLETLFRVMRATGLRRGEALALHWSDVDLDTGLLRVRWTLSRTSQGLQLDEPKTDKSRRTVPLPRAAVETLRTHSARQDEERRAAADAWEYPLL